MLFTRVGRVVAILAVILGVLRIAMGFIIAVGLSPSADPSRYIGSRTTGEVIDQGIAVVLFGVVLGVVTCISRMLAKRGVE